MLAAQMAAVHRRGFAGRRYGAGLTLTALGVFEAVRRAVNGLGRQPGRRGLRGGAISPGSWGVRAAHHNAMRSSLIM